MAFHLGYKEYCHHHRRIKLKIISININYLYNNEPFSKILNYLSSYAKVQAIFFGGKLARETSVFAEI